MLPFNQTAAKYPPMLASGGDSVRVNKYHTLGERWAKQVIDESLLGLTFDEDVEPNQRDGLPPRIFFSQSSDKV